MTAALLLPASAAVAMDPATPEVEPTDTDAVQAQLDLDELHTLIEELGTANTDLQAEAASLQASVDSLTLERDRLQESLTRFDDLKGPLEADRKLLHELRRGLPETRPEAEEQLARLRDYALESNPAALGQLVDRVEDAAPAFFDWRFTEFETTQEATAAYVSTGANAFDSSMNEFRNRALLSVANRIDGLLTVLDRLP